MERLKKIVEQLRAPEGCPWDREQTHTSLVPSLIEEAHETADAIHSANAEDLRDELGDLLLQVVMHAVIAEESGDFGLDQVESGICEKLIRRHPHVFGEESVENAEDVTVLWEQIKAGEKKGQERKSALDGVPKALPALQFAQKMQKKAAKVGFDWPDAGEGSLDKMEEEIREIREEMQDPGRAEELEEELGDFLFATVNFIRKRKFDAESLLRRATLKFESRFRQVEGLAEARGLDWETLSLEEMEELWQEVKVARRTAVREAGSQAD